MREKSFIVPCSFASDAEFFIEIPACKHRRAKTQSLGNQSSANSGDTCISRVGKVSDGNFVVRLSKRSPDCASSKQLTSRNVLRVVSGSLVQNAKSVWPVLISILFAAVTVSVPASPLADDNFLRMPAVGDHQLRVISPTMVELFKVTGKEPDPAPLTEWNFIDAAGNGTLPAASAFSVLVNGSPVTVQAVGFKRRVLYAPLRTRDLRIANSLYLQLAAAIPSGATVAVLNPSAAIWPASTVFAADNSATRWSPAIHVNQTGYIPNLPKKAYVGYYLGTLGELPIAPTSFALIDAATGSTVFTGSLVRHADVGYYYSPTPYQQVFEADFSSFNTPGEYKLQVAGLGVSFPFLIDDGVAGTMARTYELGLYHQRCGTNNVMPFTRFTHADCHTNLVLIPSQAGPEQDFVNYVLNGESASAANNPRHTAPRMSSISASLYPYVNTGLIDAHGGHHDAGDYSKYTTSVSAFVHYLTFAVDAFPGVKNLDNLGIPESGDGISDIIQEAKWEADYLARLQDADGGFYFIVYPRARQYELDVTPDHGDTQLVLPKNTAATAAATAALAEIASSPTFKAAYPAVAADYLAKALKGWSFLTNAIARYGRDGSYQMITFSGDVFMHDDELAWAAAALFAATGDPQFDTNLRTYTPNPNNPALRRWDWWSMFGGYGCAFRTYAFAARTGRLQASQLDASYVAKCEAEIKFAATNTMTWSQKMAYGSSFTDENKGLRLGGWYFSSEWTLDPATAYLLDPQPAYLDVILKNFNYELGCNPVNVAFLTGTGFKRQREIVHQYALNDYRVLPPDGIPLGNIQAQYDYLQNYQGELRSVSYPSDDAATAPFSYYDRWSDTFNVSTEFVVSQTARAVPAAALLMTMTSVKTQAWRSGSATITGLAPTSLATQPATATLSAPGLDLSKARIVWESGDNISAQQPQITNAFTILPQHAGVQWVEAEAQLPDGRRLVVYTNFTAVLQPTNTIEQYQTVPLAQNTNVVAWYTFDGTYADAKGIQPAFTKSGNATIDTSSFAWTNRPNGGALRVLDLGDEVTVNLPNASLADATKTDALSIEAMIYVNKQMAFGRGNADLMVLSKNWNAEFAWRHNIWTAGSAISGGANALADYLVLGSYLKTGQWQHLKIRLTRTGYTVTVDGQTVRTVASTDLVNWGGSGTATFKLGSFDGFIDEIVIKNEGATQTTPMPTKATVSIAATDPNASGILILDPGVFTITRDTAAATNLTVSYSLGGTAAPLIDYLSLGNSVIIPAGSTSATVTVMPVLALLSGTAKTVVLALASNANYNISPPSSATVTISYSQSTPVPPTVTITASDATAGEDGPDTGTFLITRSGNLSTNLTVQLTTGGSASGGSDYSTLPASITIAAGNASASVTVTPATDTNIESPETVIATLAANANYTIGSPSSAAVTIADSANRPSPDSGLTNYVTEVSDVDTNVVALYHFDGNFNDDSGRNGSFAPSGATAFDSSNLDWMEKTGGAALRLRDLGDNATVTLQNVELYKPGITESVTVEAMIYINSYKAYSRQSAILLNLNRRWDAQLMLNQDKWANSSQAKSGTQTIADAITLAQYLKQGCWQRISLVIDATGYAVKVNDREVTRMTSTDLTKFAGVGNVAIELGNFDGWLDELVVRSNVKTAAPTAPRINSLSRTANGMVLSWTADSAARFQVQWKASATAATWNTIASTVTSATGNFSFLDDGSQTGGLGTMRFYRLLQLP
jgi:hypothetical protein